MLSFCKIQSKYRGSKVDMVSGVIQTLIRKTHKPWENRPQQHLRLWRQILPPRPRRLKPRDPWAMQRNLQQTAEGADECPAPWNWAPSARGAHPNRQACRPGGIKLAAPPLDWPCGRQVTCEGGILKHSENSQKEEMGRHTQSKCTI
jgi:hypothetical protein